jgi:3-isopropylmalate/(R)-2-methylmalate dehydratase large subunit
MVERLAESTRRLGITNFPVGDPCRGIVHIIGPEQGVTQPGITLVCGDSHTSTHGAFGALAFGIGSSEVEHVMAAQVPVAAQAQGYARHRGRRAALRRDRQGRDPGNHRADRRGRRTGHAVEYGGSSIASITMDERMTVCKMSIEAGARAGMVAPDETTFAYLEGRPYAPTVDLWGRALAYWRTLPSDPGAAFDREVALDAAALAPTLTWGTRPQEALPINGRIPRPDGGGRRRAPGGRGAHAGLRGARAGGPAHRHPRRPRSHRLLRS